MERCPWPPPSHGLQGQEEGAATWRSAGDSCWSGSIGEVICQLGMGHPMLAKWTCWLGQRKGVVPSGPLSQVLHSFRLSHLDSHFPFPLSLSLSMGVFGWSLLLATFWYYYYYYLHLLEWKIWTLHSNNIHFMEDFFLINEPIMRDHGLRYPSNTWFSTNFEISNMSLFVEGN